MDLSLFASKQVSDLNMYKDKCYTLAYRLQRTSVDFIAAKILVLISNVSYFEGKVETANIEYMGYLVFYALVGAVTVPIVLKVMKSIYCGLVYYFRTGTASIVITNESETIDMIEASIGYQFRNRDYAVQALEKSQSLHQVGLAIINLILANQGTDSRLEVERRSLHSCVNAIVKPGPGRNSNGVAKEQKSFLYICLLAAVFRDSDESVEKVMMVWGTDGTHFGPEPTNDKSIPIIEDDDDIEPSVEQTSSSGSVDGEPEHVDSEDEAAVGRGSDRDDEETKEKEESGKDRDKS
jgi:hypothetical protein